MIQSHLDRSHRKCKELGKRLYPREARAIARLEQAVQAVAGPESAILDIGCGREGRLLQGLAPHVGHAYGLDFEGEEQLTAPGCTLIRGDAHHIPLADASMDVVLTQNAAEHFSEPLRVFTECARVLRPGGHLLVLTVNQWFPLIVLGRLLPHRIRQTVNAFLTHSDERDTFPAYYRANTAKALAGLGQAAGLTPVNIQYLCHPPTYFAFSPLGFRLWAAFDRQILARKTFAGIRHMLMGCFEKKPSAGELKMENRGS